MNVLRSILSPIRLRESLLYDWHRPILIRDCACLSVPYRRIYRALPSTDLTLIDRALK